VGWEKGMGENEDGFVSLPLTRLGVWSAAITAYRRGDLDQSSSIRLSYKINTRRAGCSARNSRSHR
jgi:hypothetical protein